MDIIAVDLGFGYVKATNGERAVQFPSVVGPKRRLFESISEREPLERLTCGDYFVGKLAIEQSATRRFNLSPELGETTRVLYKTALDLLDAGECYVVTGLPLAWYWQQKNDMRDLILTGHVTGARIVPQPLGSAMDWLLDERGELRNEVRDIAAGTVGIVDVGMHTADYLWLKGAQPNRNYSRTTRSGVHVAYKAMADAGLDMPLYEIDAAVQEGDYKSAARSAFRNLAAQVADEARTFWPKMPRLTIVTGGGGKAIYDYLDLPGAVLAKEPQTANVRGYYRLGQRFARRHQAKGNQGRGANRGGREDQGRPAKDTQRGSQEGTQGVPLRWTIGGDD